MVSSNLNLKIDPSRIVESGLELLIISGDGITQDVYEKYRVGGNLERVLNNLEAVNKAKRKAGSKLPYIEWQCLVNRWNESQIHEIGDSMIKWGADYVRFCSLNYFSEDNAACILKAENQWAPKNPLYRTYCSENKTGITPTGSRRPCYWLWRTAVVNVDGTLAPCCLYDVPTWGDAFEKGILSAWRGSVFAEARTRTRPDKWSGPKNVLVCDRCSAPFLYK
ncbi:MAG: SPASM domain-containing protein [Planctomycetes bacterium]|nr:SPASM domain-containing protein [Planctomycetota bacterium]